MKKVLIITYYWPPSGGSGVQRWLKFAKYLPQYGWEPVIYTPENPELNSVDESLLRDVSPELQVVRRRISEPYKYYKILSGKKKDEKIKANVLSSSGEGGGLSAYIRGNFFIPDPRCWWIRPSVRFLKNWLRENHVDAIVSTGPPHSMHLIARDLHRATGVPWIADFRDPWTGLFYFKHLRLNRCSVRRHKRMELSVLREADRVVVVSPAMKSDFDAILYGEGNGGTHESGKPQTEVPQTPESKVRIVTNGYDPDDFSGNRNPELARLSEDIKSRTEGKFVVCHTGLLTDSANPGLFWDALGKACGAEIGGDLYIAAMGQTDGEALGCISEAGLSEYFHDFGYVPHLLSTAWQKRANLLLLPLRKENEAVAILTGKFFEYVASFEESDLPKRILAVGPADSNLGDALRETGCGTIVEYSDTEGFSRAISEAYDDFRKGRISVAANAEKYSRAALSSRMAELLDDITS